MNSRKITFFICVCTIIFTACTGKEIEISDDRFLPETQDVSAIDDTDSPYYYFIKSRLAFRNGDPNKAILLLTRAIEEDPESSYLKKELATIYISQKDYSKAEGIVEEILFHDPDNVDILILHGKLNQIMKADVDKTKGIYEKVIAIDPEKEQIYMLLGSLYMDDGDMSNAFIVYKKLVKHFPSSFAGHFFLGKIDAFKGNLADAEKEFKRTIKLSPDLIEPRLELLDLYTVNDGWYETVSVEEGDSISKIYMQLYGRYNDSIKKKVIYFNPILNNNPDIFPGQILNFPEIGIVKEAHEIERLINEVIEKDPENFYVKIKSGLIYHKLGNTEREINIFKDLSIAADEDSRVLRTVIKQYVDRRRNSSSIIILDRIKDVKQKDQICYLAGLVLNNTGKKEAAAEQFLKINADSVFYQKAILHVAFIYKEMGENSKAITYLENKIISMGDNTDLIFYLGTFYEEDQLYDKAVDMLSRGIELNSDIPRLHFRLGVIFDKMGMKEKCIEQMRSVIQLDPENPNALNYLGYTFVETGTNLDEAESLIEKALAIKPGDGYITDSLGWLYYKKGMYGKSVKTLEKAVKLAPNDPLILEHLGDALLKNNEPVKAINIYIKAFNKNGKNRPGLKDKIEQLKKKGFEPDGS